MKFPAALALFASLALLSTGCVSLGKFHDLEKVAADLKAELEKKGQTAAELEGQLGEEKKSVASLSESKSTLEKEKEELQKVKLKLEEQKAELEKVTVQLSGQKIQLEQEKAELLKAAQAQQQQYDGIVGELKKEVNNGQLKITQYQNMLTVDVADKILFDSGHSDLKKDGKAVLQKVGDALSKSGKYIRVVGHTDNVPLAAGANYASNWELSTARATTVARFLQEQVKLDPHLLIAEGRGEFAPVAPNDTPENKQKNRRIEIMLLDRALVEAVSAPRAESPTAK
jgi:chemotaxis protein MotB